MAYSDFTFERLESDLRITIGEADLYSSVKIIEPSGLLEEVLKENIPLGLAINTEKARSELIISPVLVEFRKFMEHKISLFSGIEFNIAPEKGLNGVCDFMISASSTQVLLAAPIIQIVEAKNENIKNGIPQCIAEMCAARIFNERKKIPSPVVYGVVTTGSSWKFMQLEGNKAIIDSMEYFIDNPGKILGILYDMTNRISVINTVLFGN
uniref:Type I restriction enzyme R protein N terminus (HSDR_N) n=1 Tax=Candidatus Kentrum sp. FW TaxID=2126338 RepID=A0A450TIQ4_9GAMM|nr:MAG: hypothetical protein BECKFW1821B_GA0114236_100533 [Candidatus Kentron sp. FW]VFJ56121.1 MAG: hypothetical protein BECKFW1821A_GA0114235_10592 [Candidatus Kentron sp. FW]VFJ67211.1 MAG: hypothetical protein BECKFW1821C_GA0114237_101136 [Candidatus Kentron sp. FW]